MEQTTDRKNPYEPPRAELDATASTDLPLNLADAVNGRYDFTVGDVMDEAWHLVKGMKASFWGAAIVVGIIYLVFNTACGIVFGMFVPAELNAIVKSFVNALIGVLATPLTMGLQMLCVRRAMGQPASFATAFSYFSRAGTALASALLVYTLTVAGLAFLLIPGIYLGVAWQMTTQLVCDQKLSAWKSMETSRQAITHRWWGVLGLSLLVGLLTGLSALGLLIPLIWTVPWSMMTSAVLYRRIFHASMPRTDAPPAASPAATA